MINPCVNGHPTERGSSYCKVCRKISLAQWHEKSKAQRKIKKEKATQVAKRASE